MDASAKRRAEQSTSVEFEQLLGLHTVLFRVCVLLLFLFVCVFLVVVVSVDSCFCRLGNSSGAGVTRFILVSGCVSKRHDNEATSAILKEKNSVFTENVFIK